MDIAVFASWQAEKQSKVIRVAWGPDSWTGPWKTWEGITHLLVAGLAMPTAWLGGEWHVIGSVPGDEGLRVSARIDSSVMAKTLCIGMPKPMEMNYIVAVSLATLLLRALATPDICVRSEESLIGEITMHGADAIRCAAEETCNSMPPISAPPQPTLTG